MGLGTLHDFATVKYSVNSPPVAEANGPYFGYVGYPIVFDGSGSQDSDGSIMSYSWDFDVSDGIDQDALGQNPSHTYTEAGVYTATLTVTDDDGLTDSSTCEVTVITPSQAIAALAETVKEMNLPKGTENGLTSKLLGALKLLDKGNTNGASHKLMDFINQVEAMRNKKLNEEQAVMLIEQAQEIIDHI